MEHQVEIVEDNPLAVIVKDSGLEKTKASVILEKFKDYFAIAAEWENKSKTIIVKDESQEFDMKIARTGRLLLREKRIAIENTRKELKEQSLREGKAIDGIANVLKALIVPIEDYLEKQEKFVEIQEENKREAIRQEVEKRIEDERIAKEKADAEEQSRIKAENEKLKADALKKEQELSIARAKAEAEKKAIEEKARKEREAAELLAKEARAKAEAEKRAVEAKAEKEREEAKKKLDEERRKTEQLEALIKNQIECPHCHKKFQINEEDKK